MRILIISDTHGRTNTIRDVLDTVGDIDMFIHLGDVCGDEEYIYDNVTCPIHMVAGNNDWDSDLPMQEEFMIGRYKVFITHGHRYNIRISDTVLGFEARKAGADIALYGHTHVGAYYEKNGMTFFNPGSLSEPRDGKPGSYGYITLTPERCTFEHRYLS